MIARKPCNLIKTLIFLPADMVFLALLYKSSRSLAFLEVTGVEPSDAMINFRLFPVKSTRTKLVARQFVGCFGKVT